MQGLNRWRAVVVGLAAALVVGCTGTPPAASPTVGPTPTGPAATATPTQGPTPDARRVELTFSLWAYEGDIAAAYDEFIAAFLAQEPRVTKINIEAQPFARYHDVLNVKIAGENPPDVGWIAFNLAPAYLDAGALYDLQPILSTLPDYNFADLRPSALDPYRRGDKLYGIPFTNSTNVMYYNADIFAAANLPTPDEMVEAGTWTWANLRTAAKQIVDSGAGRMGMVFGNNIFGNGWRILEDIWAPYGAGPWSADGKTCRFNAPETVEATQLVWDMMFTDHSHPQPGEAADFFAGDVGMGLYRPSQAFRLEDVSFNWGIAPQPSGPLGYVPSAATNGIVVFADSPNADLAAEFLAFTTNVENATRMGRNFPPARLSIQQADVLKEVNPIFSLEDIDTTIIAPISAPNASWGYSHITWGPVFTNSQRIFDGQVWKPDADVPGALNNACTEINDLLG